MDRHHIWANNQKHYRKQNIKTNITGWVGAWFGHDQDWDKWWALVKEIINLYVPSAARSIPSEKPLAPQKIFSYISV
jgi:hypothetical protein